MRAKPFNYRPLCFVAFFLMVTIVVAMLNFWLLIAWLVVMLAVVGFLFRGRVLAITTLAVCIISVASFFITTQSHENTRTFAGTGELHGTVLSHNISDITNSGNFTLGNATFQGERVQGRVRVFANHLGGFVQNIAVGNVVALTTDLQNAATSNFNINNRIRYTTTIFGEPVFFLEYNNNARFTMIRAAGSFLHRFMGRASAELMHSMLFGDRSDLDGATVNAFSASGIAHVLAVSGMHVAMIIGIFVFILNAAKVPRRFQIPILFAILGFYAYLVDFRYSVLRASIMFMVLLINRYFFRKSDLLSSICFAGILILLIFPYGLLSVSFLLSFGSLIGIALFYQPVDRWLKQRLTFLPCKMARNISGAIAIYLSVTAMTIPILINYFGMFSLVGVIANLVLLPILMLTFQMSVVALLTVVGFPLLYIADYATRAVISTSEWLISHQWSVIRLDGSGYWYVLFFAALIVSSRFVFIGKRAKWVAFSILMFGYVLTIGIFNI